MKDAFGHGSNSYGGQTMVDVLRSRLPGSRLLKGNDGGGQPMSSNAAAADALTGSLKSTQAPVHVAMSGQSVAREFRGGAGSDRGARSFGDRPITNLKGMHH